MKKIFIFSIILLLSFQVNVAQNAEITDENVMIINGVKWCPCPVSVTYSIESTVVINGVKWATCNIGEEGTFVSSPQEYGNYYTCDDAQNACPVGWCLPSIEQFETLGEGVWTNMKGVYGRKFGTEPNILFLPATGYRYGSSGALNRAETDGNYWSSTQINDWLTYGYSFLCNVTNRRYNSCGYGFPVRCVKE